MYLDDALERIKRLEERSERQETQNKFLLLLVALFATSTGTLLWFGLDANISPTSGSFSRFFIVMLGNSIPVVAALICSYVLFPGMNRLKEERQQDKLVDAVYERLRRTLSGIKDEVRKRNQYGYQEVSKNSHKGEGLSAPKLTSNPALQEEAEGLM